MQRKWTSVRIQNRLRVIELGQLDNVRDLNVRSKIWELELTLKILSCQLDIEIKINLIFIVFFYPMWTLSWTCSSPWQWDGTSICHKPLAIHRMPPSIQLGFIASLWSHCVLIQVFKLLPKVLSSIWFFFFVKSSIWLLWLGTVISFGIPFDSWDQGDEAGSVPTRTVQFHSLHWVQPHYTEVVGISSQAPTSAANLVCIFICFSPKNENLMTSPDTKMSTWHQWHSLQGPADSLGTKFPKPMLLPLSPLAHCSNFVIIPFYGLN